MENIITRFPPSPTGYLHVGGARTALFNWLYARHMNGRFILRFEDTDQERSTKEYVDAILAALEWLGIDWDEGPYFQSERFDIYRQYILKLLDSGHAYYCSCSPEDLESMRKQALASGGKPKYNGRCRDKALKKTENSVIRFAIPSTGTTVLNDVVKGKIEFENSELDDFIICRSNGSPTYNIAVVIDDITMGINTIIRGDDHVNNTPKQILLYKAFNQPLPVFGHVPMVLGPDRARLSKRHGAMSVTEYKDMGYLPDALLNYLVRLGWSCGDQEFFLKNELIEKFNLENIGRSAGIFDKEKLLSLNADHIKISDPKKIAAPLGYFLKKTGYEPAHADYLEKIIKTLNTRSKTLLDMAKDAAFYFTDEITYDEKAATQFLQPSSLEPLKILYNALSALDGFNEKNLENAFKHVMDKTGLKLGKIAQPVRVALTGETASPSIFEIIEILGKNNVLFRLEKAINYMQMKLPA